MGLQMVEIDHSKFAVEVKNGNVSVNLTKMAKSFGKKPIFWLRTQEAQDYLNELSVVQKCTTTDLLTVKQGGGYEEQGTWANDYRIAMRFAQWLSPKFSIAVDGLLVNLLTKQTRLRPELAVADNVPNVPRNHVFPVDYIEICDYPIRRVTIDGQFYYCLVDIQVAAGMDTKHRSQLERGIRKAYSFKIHTKNNGKLADYLNAEGVRILCSRSSIPFARQQFLIEFNHFISPFDAVINDYRKFDYDRFLDIIVRTKDESDRKFLCELYKVLKGGIL